MPTTRLALLTGAAAILFAGYAGLAHAQTETTHVLTIRLPNGQIERVEYTGNVPPAIIVEPMGMPMAADAPAFLGSPAPFVASDPFAMLDRISADMSRQAAALFHRFDSLAAPNGGAFGVIPAMSGPGVCMRSIQVTIAGNGQPPHVVSHTAGDCAPARNQPSPAALPNTTEPQPRPDLIQVKANPPTPGLIQTVADWRQHG